MKHTFYAVNEINAGKVTIPPGSIVATVEVPDGLPIDNAVRALTNGLATQDKPAPATPAAAAADKTEAKA